MKVTLRNYRTLDFDTIGIQDEWNVSKELENRMHRIHAYPAKFPAFITTKAIQKAEEQDIRVKVVADIFCGCGTVALETVRCGKKFWGCDINPVATLIAETKSQSYNKEKLQLCYEEIVSTCATMKIDETDRVFKNERISYWFDKEHIDNLLKLRSSINTIQDEKYKKFFLCAFSNILKPCSRWLTKAIKPQIDPNKHCKDVFDAYKSQVRMMINASEDNKAPTRGSAEIKKVNFLELKMDKPFVDLVVTSPPYVTSYEYADLHQLSTLWLGYAEDFKSLRKGTIGSIYHSDEFDENVRNLNTTGRDIVVKLYDIDKGKARHVAQYYCDMQLAVQKVVQMLNTNGACLFVIGNTEYKGVKVDNAKHLTECLLSVGFRSVEVDRRRISNKILTPYRGENGRFTSVKNSTRKIYSEEFVIFAKK